MAKKVYLSPSTQENNRVSGGGKYLTEEQLCNAIADLVETTLEEHNCKIYRNTPDMSIREIVYASDSYKVDRHLAIHTNAGGGEWTEVFCNRPGNEISYAWAKELYVRLSQLTPGSDRGVKYGLNFYGAGKHIYELYYTNAPAVLPEIVFHDDAKQIAWLLANIHKIALEIAYSTLSSLGIKIVDNSCYLTLLKEHKNLKSKIDQLFTKFYSLQQNFKKDFNI